MDGRGGESDKVHLRTPSPILGILVGSVAGSPVVRTADRSDPRAPGWAGSPEWSSGPSIASRMAFSRASYWQFCDLSDPRNSPNQGLDSITCTTTRRNDGDTPCN
jgi:hypothetical protein